MVAGKEPGAHLRSCEAIERKGSKEPKLLLVLLGFSGKGKAFGLFVFERNKSKTAKLNILSTTGPNLLSKNFSDPLSVASTIMIKNYSR